MQGISIRNAYRIQVRVTQQLNQVSSELHAMLQGAKQAEGQGQPERTPPPVAAAQAHATQQHSDRSRAHAGGGSSGTAGPGLPRAAAATAADAMAGMATAAARPTTVDMLDAISSMAQSLAYCSCGSVRFSIVLGLELTTTRLQPVVLNGRV